ncbi:MAG: flagellar hook-length control protein FliK [Lachnospiraceae bacterium]|nr:flagellar hook-length control protein FliK [Lachnospiraceae bacterium]
MPISIDNSSILNSDHNRVNYNSGSASAESVRGSVTGAYQSAGRGQVAAGTVITGEIVEKDGNEVTIRLSNDQTISAKLQGNANIEEGMRMTFEVAKGANNQLSLRPLYSNLANNNAAVSALKAAGLPVNDTTLAMTDRMMLENMPVNRNALTSMFRNISAHQNVSPESIVQMTKLNMPLTDSNVIQFDNYRNFEHQITPDLQNAADGIADLFREAVDAATGTADSAASFGSIEANRVITEVLDLIDTDSLETISPEETAVTSSAADTITAEALDKTVVTTEADSMPEQVTFAPNGDQAAQTAQSVIKDTVDGFISGIREMFTSGADSGSEAVNSVYNENLSLTPAEQQTLMSSINDILILAETASDIREPLDPSQVMAAVKELVSEYPPENVRVIEAELSAYSEETSEAADEETLNRTAQDDISALRHQDGTGNAAQTTATDNTIHDATQAMVDKAVENTAESVREKITGKLNELLKSDGFTKLLKDSVKAQMSVKPEEIAEKGKIEELYQKIQRTSAGITKLMETIGRSESSVAQSAGALSDNVNFMNQLNEFVNYVQLPLKMAGEDANGELYVYTNRKNLSNSDGNFSALLHLDMEHLGPIDVYVTMRDYTKVNTNFYLQTEELLDFIEAHIDELTKRLTDKGYDTSMRVSKKEPGAPITPITDEFTKEDIKEDAKVVVSKMRFDVRA